MHAGKYYLSDSGGGPSISLSMAERLDNGNLGVGILSSQPQYELEPHRWEKPSQALKDAYADISKRMKRHLVRYKNAAWIGPEALSLYEAGQARFISEAVLQDIARYDAKQKLPAAIAAVRVLSRKNTKKTAAARNRRT